MLTKEISEVEKEIKIADSFNKYITPTSKEKEEFLKCSVDLYDYKSLTQIRQLVLEEKLSTLKFAQQKFDKFVEEEIALLDEIRRCMGCEGCRQIIKKRIDELSSKQEEI
jgi:hypothetical protein